MPPTPDWKRVNVSAIQFLRPCNESYLTQMAGVSGTNFLGMFFTKACLVPQFYIQLLDLTLIYFLTFSCMFLNPNIFFQFEL